MRAIAKLIVLIRLFACTGLLVFLISSVADAKVPDIVLKQKEAVVTIFIYEKDKLAANGSGFIIDPEGIVATNYHVITYLFKNPDSAIIIKLENGKYVKAIKILSFDEANDVALIKVDGKELPSLRLSTDYKPKQGDDVFVIGSPFGLETTISNGIISGIRGTDDFLQITAAISPGSSGSPVLNSSGEVIGIATLLIKGGQNLNFAIPAKYVDKVRNSISFSKNETLKAKIPKAETETKNESKAEGFKEHVEFAKEHLKNEQWNKAIEEYTKAILLQPEDPYLYFERGKALVSLASKLSSEKTAQARTTASAPAPSLTTKSPKDSEIDTLFNKAFEDFNKAIALQPDNVEFYYGRGRAYSNQKEHQKAVKDFDRAIELIDVLSSTTDKSKETSPLMSKDQEINKELDILNAQLYLARGFEYSYMQQYEKTIDDCTKALSHSPESLGTEFEALVYYIRAESYQSTLQTDKAIKDYEKCLTLNPECFGSSSLFLLYEETMKYKEAIKFYSYLITLYPKRAVFL